MSVFPCLLYNPFTCPISDTDPIQGTVPHFYNVGDFIVSGKVHLHTLSPHEKFKYLDQHEVPNARMLSESVQTVTRQKG